MTDRPDEFRYGLGYATVERVFPESWECDLIAEDGGRVQRALVLGPRLPEISTPARPQFVVVGFAAHLQAQPVCWPIDSRLTNDRGGFVWYSEALNWRITINRDNQLELRNANGAAVTRFVIQQDGPFIRLETPSVKVTFDDAGELHEIDAANIHLGKAAVEKLVLGSTFLAWLQAFLAVYEVHTHPDVGPRNAPATPPLPTILSDVSKTL